jgi:hypothetical protein
LIQLVAPGFTPFSRVVSVTAVGTVRLSEQMHRDKAHELADDILTGLRTEGEASALVPKIRALITETTADAVLMTGITDVSGGFALVAVSVAPLEARRVVATFATSWAHADQVTVAALNELAPSAPSLKPGEEFRLVKTSETALNVQPLGLGFTRRVLGAASAAVRPEVKPTVIGPMGALLPAPVKGRCELPDAPSYCHAWPWIVTSVVLAGAGTGIYFLTRSQAETERRHTIDVQVLAPPPSIGVGQP